MTLVGEGEDSRFDEDGACDILVNQQRIELEAFAEEADIPLLISETNKGDAPIPPGQTLSMEAEPLGQQLGGTLV